MKARTHSHFGAQQWTMLELLCYYWFGSTVIKNDGYLAPLADPFHDTHPFHLLFVLDISAHLTFSLFLFKRIVYLKKRFHSPHVVPCYIVAFITYFFDGAHRCIAEWPSLYFPHRYVLNNKKTLKCSNKWSRFSNFLIISYMARERGMLVSNVPCF